MLCAGAAAGAAGAAWAATKGAATWATDSVAQGWNQAMTTAYENWQVWLGFALPLSFFWQEGQK